MGEVIQMKKKEYTDLDGCWYGYGDDDDDNDYDPYDEDEDDNDDDKY